MICIHQEGLAAATLDGIARHAGITKGLILHYFKDKDGLLTAVYRDLYQRLGIETLQRLQKAATPRDRLFAVLEASSRLTNRMNSSPSIKSRNVKHLSTV